LLRLLVTGWVACALETFLAFEPPENWSKGAHKDRIIKSLKNRISCGTQHKQGMAGTSKAAEKEKQVMREAADVYKEILKKSAQGRIDWSDQASQMSIVVMRDWLEGHLPLLLSHLFVPMADRDGKTRAKEIVDILEVEGTALAKFWKDNWPNFLTYFEAVCKELFNPGAEGELAPMEPFNDLHKIWFVPEG
jgi:hypothetical protein